MPEQQPRVSVVLSVFEQAEFLPLVLASLAHQDYDSPWELLICDDGSTANMLEPIKEFSCQTSCEVRYIWQTDRGFRLARSRNNGVQCAKGSVVIFLDGDVVVKRDFVRRHADAHRNGPQLVCGSRSYIFLKAYPQLDVGRLLADERMGEIDRYSCLPTSPFQRARFRGRTPWYCICGCNFSVSKTAAVSFDEEFVGWGLEDCELAIRLTTRHGYGLQCLAENMVYHLEETPPAAFHPCRPRSHEQISLYMRNLQHLTERYPEQDFNAVRETALGFEYDATSETWRSAAGADVQRTVAPRTVAPGVACAKSSPVMEAL
ncbi:MAG: glycosyltransferase [Candidatus Sulfotelmatobacter sp.]